MRESYTQSPRHDEMSYRRPKRPSILSPGARRRLAGWTLRCTLTCQTRRFPTGGGFISRSRISVFSQSHLHFTQRWPFKGADGCSQSATPCNQQTGCGEKRSTP